MRPCLFNMIDTTICIIIGYIVSILFCEAILHESISERPKYSLPRDF
jgi:hypothetical protein